MTTALTNSYSTQPPRSRDVSSDTSIGSTEALKRTEERTAEVLDELTRAYSRYQGAWESNYQRARADVADGELTAAHGALAFAVTQGQTLVRALDRLVRLHHSSAANPELGASSSTRRRVLNHIEQQYRELQRLLPRAALALEKHGKEGDIGGSAADAAAAMRSLLHTRSLLSLELQKVDAVVQGLAGSSESVDLLQRTLHDVSTTVEVAQEVLRQLLVVKSKEDVVLRVSALVFVLVVLYIIAQRLFGFFPVTRYVRM